MRTIFHPQPLVRVVPLETAQLDEQTRSRRGLYTEWIVTNGLGGYASGTVGGLNTRRSHGWLIAALPAPQGRTMMLNHLRERLIVGDKQYVLDCEDFANSTTPDPVSRYLEEFRLENGLPVWRFRCDEYVIEKRCCVVHAQNTTYITWTLLDGPDGATLEVQPEMHVRPHEGAVQGPAQGQYRFTAVENGFELFAADDLPTLRLRWLGEGSSFHMKPKELQGLRYRVEQERGYDWEGNLWSPGVFTTTLTRSTPAALVASSEDWAHLLSIEPADAFTIEHERKRRLLRMAPECCRTGLAGELFIAADQFLITPIGRTEDQVRAHAVGDEIRTVIAGYPWFTDWGRDTMISLEGLTLSTGRHREAEYILRSFGSYVKNGLIPNLFPEGKADGLYNTADATLWFFHAVDRYVQTTSDWETLEFLLPRLVDIVEWHLKGTDFGIGVDPIDGLLKQGADGYQLTWMDAKVGDWVVTPRRGKAVEINALWYNALCLVVEWLEGVEASADTRTRFAAAAALVEQNFEKRFWNPDRNCLFDVVDTPEGTNDSSVRPNQCIAIALRNCALSQDKWKPVLDVVRAELLTPVGLRSLSPKEKDYKPRYDGDIWARDAAYHQGTVWAWLIGPFIDAWVRTYPDDLTTARSFLSGFDGHLYEDGVGTISEIFDAEAPFMPRGCMAQAWSVAEVLRCSLKLNGK